MTSGVGSEFTVTIDGDPVAKGRPRSGNGTTYTPARTRKAEAALRACVEDLWPYDRPVTEPVSVRLHFYCRTRRRCDWDNLAKLVTDALNKLVYADDSQILDCRVRVERGCEHPRTEVRVSW